MRPGCACRFRPKERGRGECRVPSAPAASCAKWVVQTAHEYSQRSHRKSPGIPARNGLRLISCSPRRSGFLVTVAGGMYSRRLDAGVEASGPHDFAVRWQALSSVAPPASTASHPASVTIAIRPSCGEDGTCITRITDSVKSNSENPKLVHGPVTGKVRHARPCAGHDVLDSVAAGKKWMAGRRRAEATPSFGRLCPAMTTKRT
jgi:hypothetical protein